MRQEFFNLELNTNGQSLYEFTNHTNKWIKDNEDRIQLMMSDTSEMFGTIENIKNDDLKTFLSNNIFSWLEGTLKNE